MSLREVPDLHDGEWPEVLTLTWVSRYLHISYVTAQRLQHSGKLPGRKVGGQWRTRTDDLRAMFGL
jgi:excisionase family DNA binding protein